jgi:hypothetical protein
MSGRKLISRNLKVKETHLVVLTPVVTTTDPLLR